MSQPSFVGRRFHMMGIGGAGVSALARLAAAWGAEVTGCDRAESEYSRQVADAGISVSVGHDPDHLQAGIELVVTSAVADEHPELQRARALGLTVHGRGELLAEMSRRLDTVVVAGAHGKSTTTAMVSRALIEGGLDISVAVGAQDPYIAGNARAGSSSWFVVEGDESDRSLALLSARVAVVTNLELDHHHTYASEHELFDLFVDWIASLGGDATAVLGPGPMLDRLAAKCACEVRRFGQDQEELARIEQRLVVPGRHNAVNADAAVTVAELFDITRDQALTTLASFHGVGRRFEIYAKHPLRIVDDYAHHPTEVAAAIQAAAASGESVTVIFQPHLFSRTQALWKEFATSLAAADRVYLLPIYPAREHAIAGVSVSLIADELERIAPGKLAGLLDTPEKVDDETLAAVATAAQGTLVTMGAGTVTQLAPRLAASTQQAVEVPDWFERDVPLAKMTTIGTGGPAAFFARCGTLTQLQQTLAWAEHHRLPIAVVGLGSNLLIDDRGFCGVAIRLVDELSAIEIDADAHHVRCGGGASLAAIVRRCRDAGLSGIEFGCAIPGTVGGAVKMNAGAYGGEMREVLVEAVLVSPFGSRTAGPDDLDMQYRQTSVGDSEIVASAVLQLQPGDPDEIKARVKQMQVQRSESQPRAARSFGSVFRNPDGPLGAGALIEHAGLRGLAMGGARISPKHGNFVENTGSATTDDVVQLMRLVRSRVEQDSGVLLRSEVHLLGHNGFSDVFTEGSAP